MTRYSALSLFRNWLGGNADWDPVWRSPEPASSYDVIIIGAGGHGLATAYNLAKHYKPGRIAVIDKGWLGGGNTGRNTTIVRSDYFYKESADFYDHSLRLFASLSKELNFNIMYSARGILNLAHSRHEVDFQRRIVNAMQLNGIDAELLGREEVLKFCPVLNGDPKARFPIYGAMRQKRGGTVRHDAVAWGYARAADALGVDILQNTEVTGFRRDVSGGVQGVETSKGFIGATKVGIATAGHSSVVAQMAGFRLPVASYGLQAFVSEPVKPVLHTVIGSAVIGSYCSQSDKGGIVCGGGIDPYPSFAQRGSAATMEKVLAGIVQLVPTFSSLRLLRQWAGIVDYTTDSSPIIDRGPVPGIYLNVGWGGGGFKAIPAGGEAFAYLIARDEPHPLTTAFGLQRFRDGALIDEAAAAGIEH